MFTRTVGSCNTQACLRACNTCVQPVIIFKSCSLLCNGLTQSLDNWQITTRNMSSDQTGDKKKGHVRNSKREVMDNRLSAKKRLQAESKYRVSSQRFGMEEFGGQDSESITPECRALVELESIAMLDELEKLKVQCENLVKQEPYTKYPELDEINCEAKAIEELCSELSQKQDVVGSIGHVHVQRKDSSHKEDSDKQVNQKKHQQVLKMQCKNMALEKKSDKLIESSRKEQVEQQCEELVHNKESDKSAKQLSGKHQQKQSREPHEKEKFEVSAKLSKLNIEKEQFKNQCEVLTRLEELKKQYRKLAEMAKGKQKISAGSADPQNLGKQCRAMSRKANSGKGAKKYKGNYKPGQAKKCKEMALKEQCDKLAKKEKESKKCKQITLKKKCEMSAKQKQKDKKKALRAYCAKVIKQEEEKEAMANMCKELAQREKCHKLAKSKSEKEDKGQEEQGMDKAQKEEGAQCDELDKEEIENKETEEQLKKCKEMAQKKKCKKFAKREKKRKEAQAKKCKDLAHRLECEDLARQKREKERKALKKICKELAEKEQCAEMTKQEEEQEEKEDQARKCEELAQKEQCDKSSKSENDKKKNTVLEKLEELKEHCKKLAKMACKNETCQYCSRADRKAAGRKLRKECARIAKENPKDA